MAYSLWGCKRVEHNLATKQQHSIEHSTSVQSQKNSTDYVADYSCIPWFESYWLHCVFSVIKLWQKKVIWTKQIYCFKYTRSKVWITSLTSIYPSVNYFYVYWDPLLCLTLCWWKDDSQVMTLAVRNITLQPGRNIFKWISPMVTDKLDSKRSLKPQENSNKILYAWNSDRSLDQRKSL